MLGQFNHTFQFNHFDMFVDIYPTYRLLDLQKAMVGRREVAP